MVLHSDDAKSAFSEIAAGMMWKECGKMPNIADMKSEDRARLAYISTRLKLLQAELRELKVEAREVAGILRGMEDRTSPEARQIKRRRAYIVLRPEYIRHEILSLTDERARLTKEP